MSPWPCHVEGDPEGPAVVWLHGFMGDRRDWERVAGAMPGWLRRVRVDLPGHGANAAGVPGALDFAGLCDGLMETLDALGLEEAALVGYSMGGRLALYAACHRPGRVRALVLEGTSAGIEEATARAARAEEDRRRAARIRREGLAPFLDGWYAMALFEGLRARPEVFAPMLARRLENDPEWMAAAIESLSPGVQPWLGPQLARVSAPTLLVAGQRDVKYQGVVTQLAARLPRAEVWIAPDASHNVHLEQPEPFTARVEAFLGAHR